MNWTFSTQWVEGICSIDDGPCEYQVSVFTGVHDLLDEEFPDVTKLEVAFMAVVKARPTTAEELLQALALRHEWPYRITVRCRSPLHGVLEVSTS